MPWCGPSRIQVYPAEMLCRWLGPFSYENSLKSSALYCGCCDTHLNLTVLRWTSGSLCPLPSSTTHSIIGIVLVQGMSQHFLLFCCMGTHRQFILAGIWALKPPGDWGYHERCILCSECLIQSLELRDGKRNASSRMKLGSMEIPELCLC